MRLIGKGRGMEEGERMAHKNITNIRSKRVRQVNEA